MMIMIMQNSPSRSGIVELVLIEARDLIAADLGGKSDPFIRVQYGNLKKQTKVSYYFIFSLSFKFVFFVVKG